MEASQWMNVLETKIKRFAVLFPLAYFAIMMSCQYRLPAISTDGHTYLQIARNIHYGIGLGWQALWVPPLHSILIALVARLPGAHDLQVAAGVVSLLMGVLLTVSLYFLTTAIFNRKVGVMATIVVLSFPHISGITFSIEPEVTYTAFLFASLALLLATIRKNSFPLAILTGISFSLAYLSRSEGFLIMVMILSILCAAQGFLFYKTTLARLCLTVIIMFFITSSPYLSFLKKHYGAFVISPKATYVLIWMKSQVYHDNDKGELANDDLWGLTPEGKLKWQQPSGIRDLADFLMSHPTKSLSVYLHNLSLELPGRIPNSGGTLHFPQVYPLYMALLALLAALLRWGEASVLKKTVLFAPLLILLILPVFTEGWCKYLLPYAPLLFIAACGGLFLTAEKITAHFDNPRLRSIAYLAPFGITAILAVHFLSVFMQKPPGPRSRDSIARNNDYEYTRNAALMARQRFGPGRNYMVQWNKMIYHLDGLWTPVPITSRSRMLEFARRNNVEYVIWEYHGRDVSDEQLIGDVPPGLKLAGIYRSEDLEYCAAFYELLYSPKQ
jgi:4-amino-4-deoxy-L-arabinose transferase-like glycosyltransferase